MPAEYDYRVIYLKGDRDHCYGNVTWPRARASLARRACPTAYPLTR
jgi:hypothetical protein